MTPQTAESSPSKGKKHIAAAAVKVMISPGTERRPRCEPLASAPFEW